MLNKSILAAGFGLLMSTAAAHAVPITTPPPTLSAFGNVTAVYIFADADETSILNELTPQAIDQIFCNHTTGTCTANNPGDTRDLFPPPQNGPIVFSLNNITTGNVFTTNTMDAEGNYHALITANYADFGLGTLSGSLTAQLASFGGSVTFVGFEDKLMSNGSDFDYNDLIFAFANTAIVGVPEPLTLSLFGAGLAGAALMRRRKKHVA
ncbi:MAG: PEP-CTERM sorting domain-containing protein [Chloroflexia bacterium]